MPEISDRELNRLRNSVQELSALNEIATAINLSMSVDRITQTILACCLRRIEADQGAVFLLDDDMAGTDMFHTFIRQSADSDRETPFHLNKSLTGWMIKHKSLLVLNDPDSDKRFAGINFGRLGLKSLLAAPLTSRDGLVGLLVLFNKRAPEGFSDADKRFLGIVGAQTATIVANAILFEKEQKLRAVQEEMQIARSIQESYLPRHNIAAADFEVLGFNSPASEIGGDYYDMVDLDDRRVLFAIGDVSGKGVPAALLAAQALAVTRSQLQTDPAIPLTDMIACLNRLFFESTKPEQFVTSFVGTYDAKERRLQYVNAGHVPPFVTSAGGDTRLLETGNLIVGVLPDSRFTAGETALNPGDIVFVCTDGVTENFGPDDEEYGEDRLKALISEHRNSDLHFIRDRLLTDLAHFRQNASQSDDITFLILKAK